MDNHTLIFQLPVHFLPKISLKLERLFKNIEKACTSTDSITHHYALKNLIAIIKLIEKPELKSRFIKELMRIEHIINKSEVNIPDYLYSRLFVQLQVLSNIAGLFGEHIHRDPFIQSIMFSESSQSSDLELYEPQLLFWLAKLASSRQENLLSWLSNLQSLYDTVDIYLSILRKTVYFEPINLQNGFYHTSLSANTNYHLILIRMTTLSEVVPKIQLVQRGLSIRLYEAYSMQEIKDATDSSFELAVCQL